VGSVEIYSRGNDLEGYALRRVLLVSEEAEVNVDTKPMLLPK
jgi:hypothetical protein